MVQYEITNHLGNVQAVINDKKRAVEEEDLVTYHSGLIFATDYYPFGMTMPERALNTPDYRYGYQGQETDRELWDGAVAYKYRIEDPRLGRFFSTDPLAPDYPWNSPYAFSENRVIDGVELEGLEYSDAKTGKGLGPLREDVAKEREVVLEPQFQIGNNTGSIKPNLVPSKNATKSGGNKEAEILQKEDERGFGLYTPQLTATLSANAGFSGDFGSIGLTYVYAGTNVIGIEDNDFFVAGDNKTDEYGREVYKNIALNTGLMKSKSSTIESIFTTGFEYKQIKAETRKGEVVKEQYTTNYIGIMYSEITHDYRTGKTTEVYGLSYSRSIGIGLIVNAGIKIPIYKK